MCWLWKNAFSDWIIRTGELVFLQIKKNSNNIGMRMKHDIFRDI